MAPVWCTWVGSEGGESGLQVLIFVTAAVVVVMVVVVVLLWNCGD